MKNLLLILFFVSVSAHAQLLPRPQSLILGKGALIDRRNTEFKIRTPSQGLPKFRTDESYSITAKNNLITLESETSFGLLHATRTLNQLPEIRDGLILKDRPRFPWRGVLIDVARNWVHFDELKKQISLMAQVKFNVLHLHLSDDQAFRVESKSYPKLHTRNGDKSFYTQEQIKELVAFAGSLGIRVVPEFDVPGHTTVMLLAYPELASLTPGEKAQQKYGPHDEAMDPIKESTYKFLDGLFSEMSGLFPDEFFHIGGDEVSGKHWTANPDIKKFMEQNKIKDTPELQLRFTRRMETLVKKLGKKMIAWDEVLKEKETIDSAVQIWRGPKFGREALAMNMPVIFSYGYYLDLQLSSERHYTMDPAAEMGLKNDPGNLWGGEACLWSERITSERLNARLWSRAMAVAERLWSPRKVTDVKDFYARQNSLSRSMHLEDELNDKITLEAPLWKLLPSELKDFFSWLEPGQFYSQHRYREITTETVWNQWVDVLPSESLRSTEFDWLYESWLRSKDPQALKNLESTMNEWAALSQKISSSSGEFKEKTELMALAKDLGVLSRLGLDALSYIKSGDRPGSLYYQEARTKLNMLGLLRAGMRPGMWRVVEKMVMLIAQKNAQLY